MEIVKLSKVCKNGDVFVDVSRESDHKIFSFIAYSQQNGLNVLCGTSNSGIEKLEDFLSRVKSHVKENGKIVINDLDFDFDELTFRENNG